MQCFWFALNIQLFFRRQCCRRRDYEETFQILSSARGRTNVILAGKCDSHRHYITSFSENVVEAKKNYQVLVILSFSDQERASPPSTEKSKLTFVVRKSKTMLSGVSIFRE